MHLRRTATFLFHPSQFLLMDWPKHDGANLIARQRCFDVNALSLEAFARSTDLLEATPG
jgi:hypothetical protein